MPAKKSSKPVASSRSVASSKTAAPAKRASSAKIASRSQVRNSPVPKSVAAPKAKSPVLKKEITREAISERAYFIWQREGGGEYENWTRAERELRGI